MVRKVTSCLSAVPGCRLNRKQAAVALLPAAVLIPTLFSHLILWQFELRLNAKINNKPWVCLWPGRLELKNASIDWNRGKIKVTSGAFVLRYPVFGVLLPKFTFRVEGKDLSVRLGPELAKALGRENILFRKIHGKFLVRKGSELDVSYLDAESDALEFHLKERK